MTLKFDKYLPKDLVLHDRCGAVISFMLMSNPMSLRSRKYTFCGLTVIDLWNVIYLDIQF